MPQLAHESLTINIGLFVLSALAIALSGTWMIAIADRLAKQTGLGEALMGALFLGFSTSLPGIVTSVTAAYSGYPELSISNALGDIAAQTAFLGIADITYLEFNLEYAAASVATLTQGNLLIVLLAIPLLTIAYPSFTIWGIHPASIALVAVYIFGLRLVAEAQSLPMWNPKQIDKVTIGIHLAPKINETSKISVPQEQAIPYAVGVSTAQSILPAPSIDVNSEIEKPQEFELESPGIIGLWLRFFLLAAVLAIAGYGLEQTGVYIANSTNLSENVVGSLFTALSTSLPELVTALAAVRRGALTLAVSNVLGGNSFDILFLAISDLAYRDGSIYQALTEHEVFILALTILMTAILVLGLLRREKHGIGNIGFESFFVLLLYVGGFLLVFFAG